MANKAILKWVGNDASNPKDELQLKIDPPSGKAIIFKFNAGNEYTTEVPREYKYRDPFGKLVSLGFDIAKHFLSVKQYKLQLVKEIEDTLANDDSLQSAIPVTEEVEEKTE